MFYIDGLFSDGVIKPKVALFKIKLINGTPGKNFKSYAKNVMLNNK